MGTRRVIDPYGMGCIKQALARLPKTVSPEKRELFGVHYSREKYLRCVQSQDPPVWTAGCDIYLLQRHPAPEYWPYPDAPRPKVPLPDLDKYYRPGIEQKEYFDALCRNLAGEFVYRTVENVEGIYQIRPRPANAYDHVAEDPYVLEDPYGQGLHGSPAGYAGGKDSYRFIEAPTVRVHANQGVTTPYVRYTRPDISKVRANVEGIDQLAAEYGFTWRATTGVRERELGIAGGELVVVHLKSGEVLGLLRGFARSAITRRTIGGRNWRGTENCPLIEVPSGRQYRMPRLDLYFLKKVLKPAPGASAR